MDLVDMTQNEMKKITQMSFEDALKELEHIVSKLEAGQVELSQSINFYERGEELRAHCEKQLKDAELRVEKISMNSNGQAAGLEAANIDS